MEDLTRRSIHNSPKVDYSSSPGLNNDTDDFEFNEESDFENTGDKIEKSSPSISPQKKGLYPDLPLVEMKSHLKRLKDQNHQQSKPVNQTEKGYSDNQCFWITSIFSIITVIFGCVVMPLFHSDSSHIGIVNSTTIVQDLQKKFHSQPILSLKIIKAALEKVIDENGVEPTHPAILMLLSSKGAEAKTVCFAKKLAMLVSYPNESYLSLNGEHLNKDPYKAKFEIEDEIEKSFHEGQNVVLINNLDLIPGEAAMMLHSYCDHENAPFKKAVYIMTVSSEEKVSNDADSRKIDAAADSRLRQVWNNLHVDQLSALLARLTVSVAAVIPDKVPSYC